MAHLPNDVPRCPGTTDPACNNCARRVTPGNETPLRQQLIAPEITPDGWCRNAVHVISSGGTEEADQCRN